MNLFDFDEFFSIKILEKVKFEAYMYFQNIENKKIGYKIMNFLIKNSKENEFFIDIDKELLHYYQNFWFKLLQNPEKFQLEKIKEIYDFYGDFYDENKILEESYFMKFEK